MALFLASLLCLAGVVRKMRLHASLAFIVSLPHRCSGEVQWAESVLRDPVLRVGPKGCKSSVNLCCSPEIKYLLRRKKKSCGVAEGVQIVERESKRDGYSLFFSFFFLKIPL